MDSDRALSAEIHQASAALLSLALACIDATNKYKGVPSAGSSASKELCQYADPSALQEAYDKGARSLIMACDYALALDRTLSKPALSFSPWTCLRHIRESCSMCIWVLDASINPKERATRCLNVLFEENKRNRTFLQRDLSRNRESSPKLARLIVKADRRKTQLRSQARQLGIKEKLNKRDKFLGFGDGPKSISDRIEATLRDTLLDYSLLSPQAHGDTWAMLLLSTDTESFDSGHVLADLSPLHALALIDESLHSIAEGLRNYYDLHGYDIAEYSKIVDPQRSR